MKAAQILSGAAARSARGEKNHTRAQRPRETRYSAGNGRRRLRVLDMLMGVLALVAGEAVAVVSPPSVVVGGACTCPTPANVQAQLSALARPGSSGSASPAERTSSERHDAVLTCAVDGTVDVVLRRANGERIADRAFAAQASCSDLASALAVIIGAWEADLDPHISPAVKFAVVASLPQSVDGESPSLFSSTVPSRAPDRAAVSGPLRLSAGIGVLASFTGGQVVPGAMLEADVLAPARNLGVAATLTATTSRDASVGALSVVARWSRVTAALGPDARLNVGAARVDLQVQGVAAVLSVDGTLPARSSDATLQFGGAVALRSAWAWGTSAFWVAAQVLGFPGNDRLVVQGITDQGRLPQVELQLASGLSVGPFP